MSTEHGSLFHLTLPSSHERLRGRCLCGSNLEFYGQNPDIQASAWLVLHSGDGHGPTDPSSEVTPHDTVRGLAQEVVDVIAAGVRVLRTRDGVNVSEDQVMERARNIAAGILGNFAVKRLAD